jgi:ATP-dependent RNA helicase MSS116, mitochondrial
MSPVQEKVLTELPNYTSDCLVQAKTGTGKTIAFLLPALHSLLSEPSPPPAGQVSILIISPTRELAQQIKAECDMLTSQLNLECHTAFGGTTKERHLKQFLDGQPTILVATPGRLNDYLSDDYVAERFANLRTLILDEADTMLEAGFLPDITRILQRLPPKHKGWQGMCFSATMPGKIKPVLGKVLKPGYTHISTVDPNEVPTIDRVDQYYTIIPQIADNFRTLYALIEAERQKSPQDFKAIIFGTTANGVGFLYDVFKQLMPQPVKVHELHSRLSQPARTRTTEEFKRASAGVMFASDVIGRGMDFPNVNLVIQVGLPSSGEQYVHRVGRTARAGNEGRAVIMLTDRERYFLTKNKHLPIKPYPVDLSAAAAEVAPAVESALYTVDEESKRKAYQGFLGFYKSYMKNLQLNAEQLVAFANDYAASMGCPEPPMIDKQVVGKMGLRGTKGLNIGVIERGPKPNRGGGGAQRGGSKAANGGRENSGNTQRGARPIRGSGGAQKGAGTGANGEPLSSGGRQRGRGGRVGKSGKPARSQGTAEDMW